MTHWERFIIFLSYVTAIGSLVITCVLIAVVGWGGGWVLWKLTGLNILWGGIGVGILALGSISYWSLADLNSSGKSKFR